MVILAFQQEYPIFFAVFCAMSQRDPAIDFSTELRYNSLIFRAQKGRYS